MLREVYNLALNDNKLFVKLDFNIKAKTAGHAKRIAKVFQYNNLNKSTVKLLNQYS